MWTFIFYKGLIHQCFQVFVINRNNLQPQIRTAGENLRHWPRNRQEPVNTGLRHTQTKSIPTVCIYLRGNFSPPPNVSECQRVDSLAGHVAGETTLRLSGHWLVEGHVEEAEVRPLLGVLHQRGGLPRTCGRRHGAHRSSLTFKHHLWVSKCKDTFCNMQLVLQ